MCACNLIGGEVADNTCWGSCSGKPYDLYGDSCCKGGKLLDDHILNDDGQCVPGCGGEPNPKKECCSGGRRYPGLVKLADGTCGCPGGKTLIADGRCAVTKPATNPKFPDKDMENCKFWIFGCKKLPVKYLQVDGKSFTNDISPKDVKQGSIGDCYYLAALAEIAKRNPGLIRNMIQSNADGGYTVTLYKKRNFWEFWKPEFTPVAIQVNKEFPLWPATGNPLSAQYGDGPGKKELWPMIAEKAYAQYRGSYGAIAAGSSADAMELIAGKASKTQQAAFTSVSQLADWSGKGYATTVGTSGSVFKEGLKKNHTYYVMGVNKAAGTVILGNPDAEQRGETIMLSEEDFRDNFDYVAYNPLK